MRRIFRIGPKAATKVWQGTAQQTEPVRHSVDIVLKCKLITPLFGGGVKPGEVDLAMPIRPTAVRGHLRFWWRLVHGQGMESAKLFKKECALWGGITNDGAKASLVAVKVEPSTDGVDRLVAEKGDLDIPQYALILDHTKEKRNPTKLLSAGYSFQVTLRFDSKITVGQRREVCTALRWWASFGGLGARTRRGLGKLSVSNNAAAVDPRRGYRGQRPSRSALSVINSDAAVGPVLSKEVADFGGRLVLGKKEQTPTQAWKKSVAQLQHFRQGPGIGRNHGARSNRPGRSRWPEADAIRRRSGRHSVRHKPEHRAGAHYPRAAFGLPIVFHFKDQRRGDPQDHTLEPATPTKHPMKKGLRSAGPPGSDSGNSPSSKADRMASPLILGPYFDGQDFRPMALLLPGWKERVSVPVRVGNDVIGSAWPRNLEQRKSLAKQIAPMSDHGTDALSAFMEFFKRSTGATK